MHERMLTNVKNIPASVTAHVEETAAKLQQYPKLQRLYRNCYPNTLETTAEVLADGSTFLYTGDIPAMWLRDSTAQVTQYIPLTRDDTEIRSIIRGLLKRQLFYVREDPYANSFNLEPVGHHYTTDRPVANDWVWERKYEVDSLCYPIRLAYLYWNACKDDSIFDTAFVAAMETIVDLWITEQHHMEKSSYSFTRPDTRWIDTLHNDGRGYPVNYTGMTWSGFRPSDDSCTFGYLTASNMFAVVSLRQLGEMLTACPNAGGDKDRVHELVRKANKLREEIEHGIAMYAVVVHPKYGKIYACETDGFGNHILADDANVPSLLSAPYLGFCAPDDPIYQNTRRFILSEDNPFYYTGKAASGVGSPHTPEHFIWHIALSMQGLTATDPAEIRSLIDTLVATDADTGYMHEGFHADDPTNFTRAWFAWSNSLFAEFIESALDKGIL